MLKGGYSVEVDNKDEKKAIWDIFDDHVVEEGVEHEDIGPQIFDFNLFNK